MHLYLIRHGLATWPAWPGNDAERPLTPDGARQLEAAGAGLARRLATAANPCPNHILHSPLLRARQTAEVLARHLALEARQQEHDLLRPGFDRSALSALLKGHAQAKALMLIGHNPDLAEIVNALADEAVKFHEGTVAHLQLKNRDGARLLWVATADELARTP